MNKSVVALVPCDSYDEAAISAAVEQGINLLGGILSFVKPTERIVLKPNVLIGSNPDQCICTHPSVFKAVALLLKQLDVDVFYGDSSAVGSSAPNLRKAGITAVADEMGLKLADFDHGRPVTYKEAGVNRHFVIANGVLDSDGMISISKLKTHGLLRFTGAIKNQFGCLPGILKAECHMRFPDPWDFAKMLVDLNLLLKPRLYIMDAVMAMEGNGPRCGKPKKLGLLLISADPVALDAIACQIIDIDPECVPTLTAGERAGLGTYKYETIEVVGGSVRAFADSIFKADRTRPTSTKGSLVTRLLRNRISQKPVIDQKKCSGCGTCIEICPAHPKAVCRPQQEKSSPPTYKYSQCLRCFCCQEACPEGAIAIRDTLLRKIYLRFDSMQRVCLRPAWLSPLLTGINRFRRSA